jgi:NADH:ubiquinone oxidoreductase subunit E
MSSGSQETAAGVEIGTAAIEDSLQGIDREPHAVFSALRAVQDAWGHLPEPALEYVASEFDRPLAEVVGVASFYEEFSLDPTGEHVVRVCRGAACHENDSKAILDALEGELGVEAGEVTEDDAFSLDVIRCAGLCSQGPNVLVDEVPRGRMTPDRAIQFLEAFR